MVLIQTAPVFLRVTAIGLTLALAGCGTARDRPLFPSPPAIATAGVATTHGIFVATTRHKADDPRAVFDHRRSPDAAFARIAVSVPAAHKPGALEKPPGDKADPARYLTRALDRSL